MINRSQMASRLIIEGWITGRHPPFLLLSIQLVVNIVNITITSLVLKTVTIAMTMIKNIN